MVDVQEVLIQSIVQRVEREFNSSFSEQEIADTVDYTMRKLALINKDEDYFPILFKSELLNVLSARIIAELSEFNKYVEDLEVKE